MRSLLVIIALAVTLPVWAASGMRASDRMPQGAYFRHVTDDGVVHLHRTLTNAAIEAGYQLIDRHGRVLEEVEGVKLNDEEARQRRLEKARQKREDAVLLRLYAGPDDAARARDRKVDALELAISYEENNMAQLQMKLDDEIAVAARSERSGKDVPEGVQDAIVRLQRQIALSERKLAEFDSEIEEVNNEYAPIIQRLEEINAEH
ncbi:MAG: hypothetical protein CL537_10235 [Alcanivoracaceae bacterium]|mgnify:CR=1 FL=1|nr:hypothetical protein [Alcanivoracaceae bacterium]|tara:strand:- start:7629 stop:8243 length:615 start_codon:yes stop_codon:yes gene_type:complete